MTWIFFILMSSVFWNKFWSYTGNWVVFKEKKDNFSCFIWKKLKVGFKSAIFWCWIWASIHSNHFYNLKSYSAPTCIWITLSNLGWFFQKISITYDLGQNCWDKTWPDSVLILGGEGENLEFVKLSGFLNLLDFQLFSRKVLSMVVVSIAGSCYIYFTVIDQ